MDSCRTPERLTTWAPEDLLRRYPHTFAIVSADYVLPETRGGFEVARMDPRKLVPSTRFVRLFIKPVNNARRTTPTPIRLERTGERWLITANSL